MTQPRRVTGDRLASVDVSDDVIAFVVGSIGSVVTLDSAVVDSVLVFASVTVFVASVVDPAGGKVFSADD